MYGNPRPREAALDLAPAWGSELLKQFKLVEKLNPEDKHLIKTLIDAFLTKRQIQQLAS